MLSKAGRNVCKRGGRHFRRRRRSFAYIHGMANELPLHGEFPIVPEYSYIHVNFLPSLLNTHRRRHAAAATAADDDHEPPSVLPLLSLLLAFAQQ